MSELIYFNIWNGHYKMWGYDTFKNIETGEYNLVVYYGKIQNTLSKLTKREKKFTGHTAFWDCYDYVKKKIEEKLCKGYVPIKNVVWGKIATEEITLSEFVEICEKYKNRRYEANAICEV